MEEGVAPKLTDKDPKRAMRWQEKPTEQTRMEKNTPTVRIARACDQENNEEERMRRAKTETDRETCARETHMGR